MGDHRHYDTIDRVTRYRELLEEREAADSDSYDRLTTELDALWWEMTEEEQQKAEREG